MSIGEVRGLCQHEELIEEEGVCSRSPSIWHSAWCMADIMASAGVSMILITLVLLKVSIVFQPDATPTIKPTWCLV